MRSRAASARLSAVSSVSNAAFISLRRFSAAIDSSALQAIKFLRVSQHRRVATRADVGQDVRHRPIHALVQCAALMRQRIERADEIGDGRIRSFMVTAMGLDAMSRASKCARRLISQSSPQSASVRRAWS